MGVLILSRNVAIYSTRRLTESFRSRGLPVRVLDPAAVAVSVGPGGRHARADGSPLPAPRVCVPRIGHTGTAHALAVLRHLEARGVPLTATAAAIRASRDKMLCLTVLAEAGLPVPTTVLVRDPAAAGDAVEVAGGPPVVIKLLEGTHGVGVMLAESLESARTIVETMLGLERSVLVQSFVPGANGADSRLFVVGGRVVASIRRRAPEGSFRANLHHGGRAEAIEPEAEAARAAIEAARVLGLGVAGVDLLPSDDGWLVIEVNSSPGLEGIEDATGTDVAGEIADFAVSLSRGETPTA